MSDALTAHAIANAWANPQADRQHVLKLARASRDIGDIKYTNVMFNRIPLPTLGKRYHVFVIGQNHPWTWNFAKNYISTAPYEEWTPISKLWNERQLTACLYTDTGLMMPNPGVFIRMQYDHSILVCFEDFSKMSIKGVQQFYLRVYTNAMYEKVLEPARAGMMENFGGVMSTPNQVLSWQNRYLALKAKPGLAQAFVNGILVDDFPPGSYGLFDWVDVRYDASVLRSVNIAIKDMPTFLSTLDKTQKYIFHPPRLNNDSDLKMVSYDDVDFYLIGKNGKGAYFHKNVRSAVRTLTHRDYTLNVGFLQNYVVANPTFGTINECKVRAVIRQGGMDIPVPYEHHRLRELYKMNDQLIMSTFTNARATLPEWQAANLELSGYSIMVNTPYPYLNKEIVKNGYGYNAMTRYMAETPMTTFSTGLVNVNPVVEPGPQLRSNSTFYEYDTNGLYLSSKYVGSGYRYVTDSANTRLVEGYWGRVSKTLNTVVGNAPVPLVKDYGYRLYQAAWTNGVINEKSWKDVTDDRAIVGINNGIATWLHNPVRFIGMVLFNNVFLGYDFELAHTDRTLSFAITHTWPGGGLLSPFPLGKIDIVMNGRSLVPEIDYYIDFPRIVIVSKKHINQSGPNKFTVRSYGFCTSDLKLQPYGDIGWVQNGQVSYNSLFNLRDDRNVRCLIGGQMVRREDLVYNEDRPTANTLNPNYNGLPYYIDNVMSAVNGVVDYQSYPDMVKSQDLDKRLESYISSLWPQPPLNNPTAIVDKYAVYSPFFHKVMMDLKLGVLILPGTWQSYEQIDTMLAGYKWWLDYDPCVRGVDDQFVLIQPHGFNTAQTVTVAQYTFLQTITKIYLGDKISLSGHLTMSGA